MTEPIYDAADLNGAEFHELVALRILVRELLRRLPAEDREDIFGRLITAEADVRAHDLTEQQAQNLDGLLPSLRQIAEDSGVAS